MKYYKLCQKADEIQAMWKPKSGDIYHFKCCINSLLPSMLSPDIHGNPIDWENSSSRFDDKFWLPSLEDLFTIYMESRGYTTWGALKQLGSYYNDNIDLFKNDGYIKNDTPIKEACLMCVMESMYSKVWNSEKEEWKKY